VHKHEHVSQGSRKLSPRRRDRTYPITIENVILTEVDEIICVSEIARRFGDLCTLRRLVVPLAKRTGRALTVKNVADGL
jgi:hypothetical protein